MTVQRRLPILMYHLITPAPEHAFRKYAITPAEFDAQMRWIAVNGFVPIHLDDAFGGSNRPLPAKPLVITFDDGFRDCFDYAVPILSSYGFTATFFIVAGLAGKRSEWLPAERGVEYDLMDWTSIRALADRGFECGAHTMTHPRLARASAEIRNRELHDSRCAIEDEIGRPVRHLSYPFGSFDADVRDAAERLGYRTACTVARGVATTTDDPLTLARIPVNGTDAPLAFAEHVRETPAWALAGHRAVEICRHFLARL
jgi:peptidoglycan/xylan/chitin deacetylase (PgdA/CDA1 family)